MANKIFDKDVLLVSKVQKGDLKAFENIYELYSKLVYNLALSYVQNEKDAEEVTQDVFVSVFKNIHSFHGKSTLLTWIYRIAINTSLSNIDQKKRKKLLPWDSTQKTPLEHNHPGVLLENKESATEIHAAINTLNPNQKTAFILVYIEGRSGQETADIMELGTKAIESLLQRAKANLRKKLKNNYLNRRK